MTTYRVTGKVISTDPSRLKGDTTTWECDLAAGLELRKTYADGKGTLTQTVGGEARPARRDALHAAQ